MVVMVSVVKNSADIIETMIRMNAVTADRFVIMDNMSTDRTREILEYLREEGYPIDILVDEDQAHNQRKKMEYMMQYAIEKYGVDVLIPIDDDEIFSIKGECPVKGQIAQRLEALPSVNAYYIQCNHYVPTAQDNQADLCLPQRQQYCINEEEEMTRKVIIPAAIISEDFALAEGNHFAIGSAIREDILLPDLRLAHYPIRSAEQIASKVLTGWMNNITREDGGKKLNDHWFEMYKIVKNGGVPTIEMMQYMASLYRDSPIDESHYSLSYQPIQMPKECFELKYTGANEVNYMRNFCENLEILAKKYAELTKG